MFKVSCLLLKHCRRVRSLLRAKREPEKHPLLSRRGRRRVAAPCVCFVPCAALASCRPLSQQLLPVSATGRGRRRCKLGAARPFQTPKLLGSIQKIQVASLKDFLCSADWKPLSRCATAPSKREPLAKPESVMVCPETLPLCQGLSLWESWQARQGLTERASQLPGAHSKSFVLSPETVQFLIFPPLKVKNPAEKRFRWFKNRFGCAILGVKVPVWTGNRRA